MFFFHFDKISLKRFCFFIIYPHNCKCKVQYVHGYMSGLTFLTLLNMNLCISLEACQGLYDERQIQIHKLFIQGQAEQLWSNKI